MMNNGAGMAASLAGQGVRQAKRAMRRQMANVLMQLPSDRVAAQSAGVTEHVLHHPAFRSARTVSIYVSMEHSEVRTEELCKQTLMQGKRLYVPRFASVPTTGQPSTSTTGSTTAVDRESGKSAFASDMRMLRVSDWEDFEAMAMNRWGIREPDERYRNARREDGERCCAGMRARGLHC